MGEFKAGSAHKNLFGALLQASRRYGKNTIAVIDGDGTEYDYKTIIRGAFALGGALKRQTKPRENVGLMLPTGIGAVIAFFAIHRAGRVPTMINFTAGARNILAGMKAANVKTIVTAKKFIELGGLEKLESELYEESEIIYLEDVREQLTLMDKVAAVVGPIIPKTFRATPSHNAPGVILFTSGTEGNPKGVVLSHANLVANVEQIRAHIDLSSYKSIFSPLPVFHTLGLTGGVILPLLAGMKVALYPSPLHVKEIPAKVRQHKCELIFATDTFIAKYARAAKPGDLDSLRMAVCGAERVKHETRDLLKQRCGLTILEGYGATEASPVIAVNQPDANKHGTVGKLLPAMEYRLEEVEGIRGAGRLFVRGPNVMSGYYKVDAPEVLVPPKDGWHDTGDIVHVDEEGYISIRGRAKRFAKIGGEMVSLTVVENCAKAVWPDHEHVAVAMADGKKGEQVVLLTENPDANRGELLSWAQSHGVAELSVPRQIMVIDEVPLLGSGKVNYTAAGEIVRKKMGVHDNLVDGLDPKDENQV